MELETLIAITTLLGVGIVVILNYEYGGKPDIKTFYPCPNHLDVYYKVLGKIRRLSINRTPFNHPLMYSETIHGEILYIPRGTTFGELKCYLAEKGRVSPKARFLYYVLERKRHKNLTATLGVAPGYETVTVNVLSSLRFTVIMFIR